MGSILTYTNRRCNLTGSRSDATGTLPLMLFGMRASDLRFSTGRKLKMILEIYHHWCNCCRAICTAVGNHSHRRNLDGRVRLNGQMRSIAASDRSTERLRRDESLTGSSPVW